MKSDAFSIASDLDRFASICAAACHDIDHNGFTNIFHMKTQSSLAILYNDKSVLENHHAALGWKIIRETNLLKTLNHDQREQFRSVFIHCILGTDMSLHSSHLEELITIAECRAKPEGNRSPLETAERMLALSVHTADISNVAKPFDICTKNIDRLFKEFFRQGDEEKRLGLPFSMMCDRETTNIQKSEALYIQLLVKPWFNHFASVIQGPAKACIKNLESNYNRYVHSSTLQEPPKLKITKRKSMFERGALLKIQQMQDTRPQSDQDFPDSVETPDADELIQSNHYGALPHHGRVHSGDEIADEESEEEVLPLGRGDLTPNATPEEVIAMNAELPPKNRPSLAEVPTESTARIPASMLSNSDDEDAQLLPEIKQSEFIDKIEPQDSHKL